MEPWEQIGKGRDVRDAEPIWLRVRETYGVAEERKRDAPSVVTLMKVGGT